MNDLYHAQRRWKSSPSRSCSLPSFTTPGLHDKLLQMPQPRQLLQMILQNPTLLSGVPFIPVVNAIKILISSRRIAPHLAWPPKVWLILYPLQNLMHRLLKRHIYLPCPSIGFLNPQIPFGSQSKTSLSRLLRIWHCGRCLPFILLPVIFQPFILLNTLHKLSYIFRRFYHQRLWQFIVLGQAQPKSTYSDLFITFFNLIV